MSDSPRQKIQGTATVSDGAATAAILASQGGVKKIRLKFAIITVTTAAVGGTGLISLKDGSTVIISVDADAVGTHVLAFGDHPEMGYDLTAATALNVVAEGAGTTQATASAVAIATVLI